MVFSNFACYDPGGAKQHSAIDSEVPGCLICDNGWIGPDRDHGPGIYDQNQTGTKLVTDNIEVTT